MIQKIQELWIILDTLDECTTKKGSRTEGSLSWIGDLLNERQINVYILVMSRPEKDIKSAIYEWSDPEDRLSI